jgi:hypothetical protein
LAPPVTGGVDSPPGVTDAPPQHRRSLHSGDALHAAGDGRPPDGRLDTQRVMEEFAAFWRQHGEILGTRQGWHEVAPQLVAMAWLQRIVNGGGHVERQHGIGRGRIDLLVRWPWTDAAGRPQEQREAVEQKVWAPGRRDPLAEGLAQLDGYLARVGLDRGWLVVFDRRPEAAPIEERTRFEPAATPAGRAARVLLA